MNMQDFYTGHAFDAYEFFGAHTYFGGTHFAVWAPSAQHIAVETEIGTFDLHRTQSAVWECDAPGVQRGYGLPVLGARRKRPERGPLRPLRHGYDTASRRPQHRVTTARRASTTTNGCRHAQNASINR